LVDPEEPDEGLTDVASRMSRLLLSRQTVQTVLELLTSLIQETLPATTGTGVTLVDAVGKRTTAASDLVAEQADALQYELEEGPCLTAWRDRRLIRIDDLEQDGRWPRWAPPAAALGLRSVLSAPMIAGDESLGAIKAYSLRPGAYGARDGHLLELFAKQAAVLLTEVRSRQRTERETAGFLEALRDRDILGQAKGVLMGRGAANGDVAYAMLLKDSERSDVTVHEAARRLIASVTARNAGGGS